jgi:cell surface protein SprA
LNNIVRLFRQSSLAVLGFSAAIVAVYAGARADKGAGLHAILSPPVEADSPHVVKKDSLSLGSRTQGDTNKLIYPITPNPDDPYGKLKNNSMDLKNPSAIEKKPQLDSTMKYYKISNSVGNEPVEGDKYVPFKEYNKSETKSWVQDYFKKRSQAQSNILQKSIIPPKILKDGLLENMLGGLVDIRPTGTAELSFAGDINRIQNPNWSLREQRTTQFKFDQKLNLNVIGNIGNRIKLGINYNTEANFDFQNQKKLNYLGLEDEIVKSIELGDVSMPVSNSLISGSQSLFGIKTQLQFGRLFVTGVFSQAKGEHKEISVENGAQKQTFNVTADQYDANRHFFLAHYFRNHFNEYNRNYPSLSNVVITRMEVWVTNTNGTIQNTRSAIGFMDLGEDSDRYNKTLIPSPAGSVIPDNNANPLYGILKSNPAFRNQNGSTDALDRFGFKGGLDYVKNDNMKQLSSNEFSYNSRLGYLSLNAPLPDGSALAVAFEYTVNGAQYQVGEFARDVSNDPNKPDVIFLKMLRGTNIRTTLPIWNLMMKNIYSFGGYQVQPTDFRMQVIYEDNKSGAFLNYLPVPTEKKLDGIPLLRIVGMDRFNSQLEAKPDGNFDYLDGITINSSQGRIIFPVLEPFGKDLKATFNDKALAETFVYDSLYTTTQSVARQQTNKNKFYLRGTYQGASGSDIALNAINVPQGSVKVYAGGQELRENVDYTVDYTLGRVKIINAGIANSGSVIRVSLESNSLFSIQQKTLMGTRAEYRFTKDLYLGGTVMYLRERPLTQKVNVGEEAIRNLIYGFDGSYATESRLLTQLVDKLPFIQTKEKSSILMKAEYAQIIPGHPTLLNDPGEKGGVSYIDDFEGSEVPYDLKLGNNWVMSSAPTQTRKFPEASLSNDLKYNFNRAKLAWYTIDPLFFRNNTLTPAHIQADKKMQSDPYMREVLETEVFPNKQLPNGVPGTLATFDLAYYPYQRGPYNYNVNELDIKGHLTHPENRWAGIMRKIETSDFEAANIEYVEFWMMDPFIKNQNSTGGQLYVHLGNISEDILKDGRRSWENGLPKSGIISGVDTSVWGRVPNGIQVTNAFDNDPTARQYQDVGYDGLGPSTTDNNNDADEKSYFKSYIDQLRNHNLNPSAFSKLSGDPSGDNFHFYTGGDFDAAKADILHRYMDYNNPQGNTPVSNGGNTGYGSPNPDDEDINHDYTVNSPAVEDYYEYKVNINKTALVKDRNFVTDVETVNVPLKDGSTKPVTWYHLKVPIYNFTNKVGTLTDFKSIRFMRMYMTGFSDSTVLRFGKLQLVRGDWRKYIFSLTDPGPHITSDPRQADFTVSTVSLEQNSHRKPPYVIPPGVQRTIDQSTPDQIQQNEASLSLKVCNLEDGDAKAVFKNTTLDARLYKKMKMYVHAEGATLRDNDMRVFIRMGTDLSSNYYEYEMPVKATPLNSTSKDAIWPADNNVIIQLSDLYGAKQQREVDKVSLLQPYVRSASDGKGTVTVIGNPDLSNIKALLIGVRNPKDNGQPICGEVWVDELRLTDFDETGGWAANATVKMKLADLGTLAASVNRKTIGFGSIDQTVQQRSQKDTKGFDFASSLELGKFFPKKLSLKIPMYYTYSQVVNTPRFNPLRQDLPFNDVVNAYSESPTKQDSVLKANQDFTSRTSLNFTNIQKLRGPEQKKQHIYDIENLYATYAYSEIFKRNIERVYDYDKNYRAILGYNYSFPIRSIQPFKKVGTGAATPYTKLITDINFNYVPTSLSVSAEVLRHYNEILYRNTDDYKAIIVPLYDKSLRMNRKYDFRWVLTKSLKYSYSGGATSRYQENDGAVPLKNIIDSLRRPGILQEFNQSHNLTYDVPINKLPFFDFVTLQTNYQGTYHWLGAIPARPELGATISNSATKGLNLQLTMTTLYNRSPFFKTLLSGKSYADKIREDKQKIYNDKQFKLGKDTTHSKQVHYNGGPIKIAEGFARALLSLRNVSATYTATDGTALPGFQYTPTYLGMDGGHFNAPGLKFVTGLQETPTATLERARSQNWITQDTNLSAFYLRNHNTNFTGQATLEPIKSFRITVDFTRRESQNHSAIFKYGRDPYSGKTQYTEFNGIDNGNFAISVFTLPTAFSNDDNTFNRFEAYRRTISQRLGGRFGLDPTSGGYYLGYGRTQQDVLLYSFLAAYSGKDPSNSALNPFPSIPLPSWKVNYTGLSNLDFVKRFIKTISITHSYRSNYTVGNYQTTLGWSREIAPIPSQNIAAQYRIDNFSIMEDFAPLIGVDISWVSKWTSRIEYRKSRNMAFSMTNLTLTEILTNEFIIGAGYRTNKLLLPFRVNRKRRYLNNDFNFRLDFSIRDNKTSLRILDQGTAQPASGAQIISLKPTIDYTLSKSLLLKIFYTQNITNPHVSNQYPTSQITFGFSLRYTLTP